MAKFMIVDDSRVARITIKSLIEEAGHEVIGEADNGLDGYDLYAELEPDVLTLDITMSLVSGVDCLKSIIKNFPNAKVIMIATTAKDSQIKEVSEIGAKDVLVKPFDKEEAFKVFERVLIN